MDKSTLEQLLSRYNWWLGASTIAVAIGILGEYVTHFIFEKEKKRVPEKIVSLAFVVLVLGGVVGEYVFGSRLSAVSGELQRTSDAEVAALNREAGDARKSAADALERAVKAEKQTEEERLGRVKIEERLAQRRIGPREHDAMVAVLRQYRGSAVAIIRIPDPEASFFAADVTRIFSDSGWVIQKQGAVVFPAPYGLQCIINETSPAGGSVAQAFGLLPGVMIAKGRGMHVDLEITVGFKPHTR